MSSIIIRVYTAYHAEEILPLYESVGWTNYVNNPELLKNAFTHSLKVLAAYDGERLVGILRAVGDGFSMVYLQDILVYPAYQRKGIGAGLVREALALYPSAYQKALMTDDTPKTVAFYRALGFHPVSELGCTMFFKND